MAIFSKVGSKLRPITWGPPKIPQIYFAKICTIKLSEKSQSVMVKEYKKSSIKKEGDGVGFGLLDLDS